MKDKEKQIEEIAKRIHIATDLYYMDCIKVATYLFEKDNCRIIDKDSVVLSREEAERFRGQTINIAKVKSQASKETAEKILNELVGHTFEDDGWTWTVSKEDIQWLADKQGVEIKET